jgi:ankyrin repeat protein
MEGDEKVRFCSGCQLHVFNLSAMDVEEAAKRIAEHSHGLCVRFYRRQDGTLLTRDCPTGAEMKRQARRGALGRIGALAVGVPLLGVFLMPTQGAVARPAARRMAMRSAIVSGKLQLLTKLLDAEQDADAPSSTGLTLLMLAARADNLPAARLLLTRGADPARRDSEGRTALAIAREEGSRKVIALLQRVGAPE